MSSAKVNRPEFSGRLLAALADHRVWAREGVITDNAAKLAMELAQKRTDLKSKILRDKDDVPSATDLAQQRVTFEQVRGKRLWGLLITALTAQGRNPMLLPSKESQALAIPAPSDFASNIWTTEELAEPPAPAPVMSDAEPA